MTDLPADWAIEEALKRAKDQGYGYNEKLKTVKGNPRFYSSLLALADMIEKYKKPPTDPLLVEAREIIIAHWNKGGELPAGLIKQYREGFYDNGATVQCTYEALKRGVNRK